MINRFLYGGFLFLLATLAGCAEWQAATNTRAGKAADSALNAAQWAECQGATFGAIRRQYKDIDEIAAFIEHCNKVAPTQ